MPHVVSRLAVKLALVLALIGGMNARVLRAQTLGPLDADDHRQVSGIVTDHHHEPLRGAIVQLQQGDGANIVTVITGDDGRYRFLRLDGDLDYRIWVKFRNRTSRARSISKFDDHPRKVINFVIAPY